MIVSKLLSAGLSVGQIIAKLKEKQLSPDPWEKLICDFDPTQHRIVHDSIGRKDKVHSDGTMDKASRIHLGLEKLLTKRTTEFTYGTPVKRNYYNIETVNAKLIQKAIEAIFKYVRIDSENIKRGNKYYAACEICSVWYMEEKPNTLYGFKSKYKVKCKTYSPMDGTKLYPLFDENDDLIAMSFEYVRFVRATPTTFFETFTKENHYKWVQRGLSDYDEVAGFPKPNAIDKIPCVYVCREHPVWYGLTHLREELEYTLSRNSDIIAYNSAPLLKVVGELVGEPVKSSSTRVVRVEQGGDVSYVSWSGANQAITYQVSQLLNLYFMQGQMPDLSFENMKGLGNIGYDARKLMFSDAHLKVADEAGALLEFHDREINVVKAFLAKLNTSVADEIDNVEIENVITPFNIESVDKDISTAMTASGGKPVISQLDAIRLAGFSNNPDLTLKMIKEENSIETE